MEDVRKIDSGMAYQIRTSGCTRSGPFDPPKKITLDLIEYTNCAAQSDGNGSSKGASLAIIIPVVVAAVLLVAAVLYLIRSSYHLLMVR